MTNSNHQTVHLPGIADVERDTGLSKDTLRVWERRYGFPAPLRDTLGERRYDEEQVNRLRHIRRLLDAGYRPGRIVSLPLEQLLSLHAIATGTRTQRPDVQSAAFDLRGGLRSEQTALPAQGADAALPELERWLGRLSRHDAQGLRESLADFLQRHGLARLIVAAIAPMNERVGQAWLEGRLAVHAEHLYTECVQTLLRQALGELVAQAPMHAPHVLLTTLPGESHGLGILMAECFLALSGCQTLNLGVQTPMPDILGAQQISRCDVVALGFTAAQNPRHARAALNRLREHLPPDVEVWAGGRCDFLARSSRKPAALTGNTRQPVFWPMPQLQDITLAVTRWRAERARA